MLPLVWAQPAPPWCVPGTTICMQGQGQGQGAGQGTLGGSASGQVGPNGAQGQAQGNAQAQGQANGNAQGNAQGRAEEEDDAPRRSRRVRTGPPLALGMIPCLVGRVGIWSGYRGGACFAFGLRAYSGVGFELD